MVAKKPTSSSIKILDLSKKKEVSPKAEIPILVAPKAGIKKHGVKKMTSLAKKVKSKAKKK